MYLTTEKDYGDFEFHVDWKMVSPNGDSGVYLRGFPQVQVWDPDNPREVKNGAPRGSGALWNNNPDNPGRWPLVKADNPVGQWNTFRIRMVGNRVSVWLNDKQTVDNQVMDNYFNRAEPVLPRGPISLQTHGSEVRFRNIYVSDEISGVRGDRGSLRSDSGTHGTSEPPNSVYRSGIAANVRSMLSSTAIVERTPASRNRSPISGVEPRASPHVPDFVAR